MSEDILSHHEAFRIIFQNAGIGLGLAAADGRLLAVNDALCQMLDYSRDELLNKTYLEITHPADLANDRDVAMRYLAGEIPMFSVEKRYLRKNGLPIWVRVTVSAVREAGAATWGPFVFVGGFLVLTSVAVPPAVLYVAAGVLWGFWPGVAINVLNPKLSIFFVAFLPQFIATNEASPLARMLELSGVFMAMTFVVFALYGQFAAAMRDHVVSRPAVMAWLRRTFAAAFVALGAKLALTER